MTTGTQQLEYMPHCVMFIISTPFLSSEVSHSLSCLDGRSVSACTCHSAFIGPRIEQEEHIKDRNGQCMQTHFSTSLSSFKLLSFVFQELCISVLNIHFGILNLQR